MYLSTVQDDMEVSTYANSRPGRTRTWDSSDATWEDVLTTSDGLPISPWYGVASSVPALWDIHLMKDINQLEKVQRWAARWISSNYNPRASVTDILKSLKLDTLEERTRMKRLVFLYKILNHHVAVPVSQMDIGLTVATYQPNRGNSTRQRLIALHSRTSELKNSFIPKTVAQWNSLPDSTTQADSVLCFRNRLTSASCP